MSEFLLSQNPDGTWGEYKEPYCTIEIETKEDFKMMQEAVQLYHKVKDGKAIVSEWISNSERMPNEEEIERAPMGKFLISIFGVVFEATYKYGYFLVEGNRVHSTTHWMNYPQPPKKEQ